jgi:cell division protein FtsW
MFTRQLLFMALGIGVASILTFVDYHRYKKLAILAMAGTILLLFVVLVVNEVINNAARTIFQGSGQPSEIAKLVLVIYLSVWLSARRDQLSNVSFGLIPLGIILGILGGLIFLQPDLSASTTIFLLSYYSSLRRICEYFLCSGFVVGFIVFVSPSSQRVGI